MLYILKTIGIDKKSYITLFINLNIYLSLCGNASTLYSQTTSTALPLSLSVSGEGGNVNSGAFVLCFDPIGVDFKIMEPWYAD